MASSSTAEKSVAGVAKEVRLLMICTGSAESLWPAGDGALASLLSLRPHGVSWSTMNERFEPEIVVPGRSLRKLLGAASIDWVDGRPPDAPTHRATVVGRLKKRQVARLRMSMFAGAEPESERRLALMAELPAAWIPVSASAWLTAVVCAAAPRWARVDGPRAMDSETAPRAGWLTYLSRSLGPLPPIPPPTAVVPVDDVGWIIVAQPEPIDPSNAEHRASLAYVRHALGARVLLDGPSIAPPAAEPAAGPPTAPVEALPAPETPSYLKAPPAASGAAPAPPGAEQSAAVLTTPPPFTTETRVIDVSRVLKPVVPFHPDRPPATAAAVPNMAKPARKPAARRAATPSDAARQDAVDSTACQPGEVEAAKPAPDASFCETKDIDVAEILKRAPPVPFAPSPAARGPHKPTVVTPDRSGVAGAASPAARRRLVRFDPQTGTPLAQPYWEELPIPEIKK